MQKQIYEYVAKVTNNPIIERKICKASGEEFPIFQKERELLDKISPVIWGKKYSLPSPKYCYWVRMLKRHIFRNEKNFSYATCSKTGKKEVSIIHEWIRKIINTKDRYEEDFFQYWVSYSGNFEQDIKKLFETVPYLPRRVLTSENSEYCNQAWDEKNCYLCIGWQNSENCMYSTYEVMSKYVFDSYAIVKSEIVYNSIHVFNSMKSFFSNYLLNCYNVWFGHDLKNCKNVLFGFWLTDKEYIYKDIQYTKEEWEKIFDTYKQKIKTINWVKELQKEFKEFVNLHPHKWVNNTNAENSIGTQINNTKNMIFGFWTDDNNDSFYCGIQGRSQNVIDVEASSMSEMIYNSIGSTKMYGSMVEVGNFWELKNSYYGLYVWWGSNILWCFWLINQEYCILNKKYSKEERELLAQKIAKELQSKGKRGEFFDTELSPFPYNDTVTNKYFPIKNIKTNNEIQTINPNWIGTVEILEPEKFISNAILDLWGEEKFKIKRRTKNQEINLPEKVKAIKVNEVPDNIDDVQQDILNKVVLCEVTGRPFRIMKLELDFHKQYGLALPTRYPEYRDEQRFTILPSRFLDLVTCQKCWKETICEYKSIYEYKIRCEECYNKEMFS